MSPDSTASHPRDIAAFALRHAGADSGGAALVFVTDVEGGSLRAPGLRMAVMRNGAVAGFVSNGCVEADLVGLAVRAIEECRVVAVSYGAGSGQIDIVLPCGGRIDLLVVPVTPAHMGPLAALVADERSSGAIRLGREGALAWEREASGLDPDGWVFTLHPKVRLLVVGAGHEALLLARLAAAADMAVELVSPDDATVAQGRSCGLFVRELAGLSSPAALAIDGGTAIALMFHDHEWEHRILLDALGSSAFYIGALGSHRASLRRAEALAEAGCGADAIARIRAPIGLVPRLRDPNLLAVSVLAEIAAEFSARFRTF